MPYPTREGTYRGEVLECVVEEKEGKCPQLILKFLFTEEWNDAAKEWETIGALECTSYNTLINKDGNANTVTFNLIRNCFGVKSDAEIPQALMDGVPVGMKAQVVLKTENDQNGVPRLRSKFINPENATPGRRANPAGEGTWGRIAKAAGATKMPTPKEDDSDALPF